VVIGLIDHDSDGDRVNTRFTDPKQANGLTSAATAGSATQPVTHAR
jgi:hypothetical protein